MMMSLTTQARTLAQADVPPEDAERQHAMREAWKAYQGKLPDPLIVEAQQPNDNMKTNRCAPIVNKTTSFLFGQELKIECSQQKALDQLWGDDDERMTRLSKMGINGSTFGHCFLKLIPNAQEGKPPRMVILNPQIVRMVNHPDDCELRLAYVVEYPGTTDLQKKQIISRIDPNDDLMRAGDEPMDTWLITNYVRRGQGGNWLQTSQEEWPYPFAPVFDWQNLPNPNEAWGTPDLTDDIIQLNRSLNFLQSNLARIIKYHGHPKTFLTGVRASQVEVAPGEALCLPDPQAKASTIAPMENFSGLLEFIADVRGSMDELSRIPSAMERIKEMPKGNISGVALRLFFQGVMDLTVQKRRLYGAGMRAISRAGLVLMGALSVDEYEDYHIVLPWQNMLPIDDNLAAQTAQLLIAIGVSEETVFNELGYDVDEQLKKKAAFADKKQAMGLSTPPPVQPSPQPGQPMPSGGQPGQPQAVPQQQQQGGQAA